MSEEKKPVFDDVSAIVADRTIGTFIVPLSSIGTSGLRNSREEDFDPATIAGIQSSLGSAEDNADTQDQLQEVSVGFVDDGLEAYAGLTRIEAMTRKATFAVIAAWNEAMGYKSPKDEGYISPDGRGLGVAFSECRDRVSGTSEEWNDRMEEALEAYPVRVRTADVSSREAYARSVEENAHRSNPSVGARGRQCAHMRNEWGLTNKQIANDTKQLEAHVSQFLLIADIPAILDSIATEYGAEDSERELLAKCIEEWGRRTFLRKDSECAIPISHARILGPSLRGHKKNAVDFKAALSLMMELCRVDDDGKIHRNNPKPDLSTFKALVDSAKDHGVQVEVEVASGTADEIANLIAQQGGDDDSDITDMLAHIGGDSETTGETPDIDVSSIISGAEGSNAPDVDITEFTPEGAKTVSEEDAASPVAADVDVSDALDFNTDGEVDFDALGAQDDSEIEPDASGEKSVSSVSTDEIATATIESKPRSTLLKLGTRALVMLHTSAEEDEGSDDEVIRIFGVKPALLICQIATAAAFRSAANEEATQLNNTLAEIIDAVDEFLSSAVQIAATNLSSAEYRKLAELGTKIDLDKIS